MLVLELRQPAKQDSSCYRRVGETNQKSWIVRQEGMVRGRGNPMRPKRFGMVVLGLPV